jgi:signal transduction histidine kinase
VQFQQVMVNLIVNAVEALIGVRDGIRELTIVSQKAPAHHVLVEVRHTGPGLGSTNLDRLFQSFYTTKPDGMGMGLAICRSTVEVHRGRLSAASNKPRGAVFRDLERQTPQTSNAAGADRRRCIAQPLHCQPSEDA